MTQEKLWKIVRNSLARKIGAPPDEQASAVVSAIRVVLEAESLDRGDEPPSPDKPIEWPLEAPTQANLPLSPAVQPVDAPKTADGVPASRLIVLPGSPEAREVERSREAPQEVRPIRPDGPIRSAVKQEDVTPKWAVIDLSNELHRITPEKLTIHVDVPERGRVPVTLERNIIVGPGFDAVKLSYKHPALNEDMAVAETFWCYQERLDVTRALQLIEENARKLYRPRGQVVSHTPRKIGDMTFSLEDPHDVIGKLYDSSTGRYF